jgi:hypothetical protein
VMLVPVSDVVIHRLELAGPSRYGVTGPVTGVQETADVLDRASYLGVHARQMSSAPCAKKVSQSMPRAETMLIAIQGNVRADRR